MSEHASWAMPECGHFDCCYTTTCQAVADANEVRRNLLPGMGAGSGRARDLRAVRDRSRVPQTRLTRRAERLIEWACMGAMVGLAVILFWGVYLN